MTPFSENDIVKVEDADAQFAHLLGLEGTILGLTSESDEPSYAVYFADHGVVMFHSRNLTATGKTNGEEDIYGDT